MHCLALRITSNSILSGSHKTQTDGLNCMRKLPCSVVLQMLASSGERNASRLFVISDIPRHFSLFPVRGPETHTL